MSTRVSALISLGVHAAIVGALLWMSTAGGSDAVENPGVFGTATETSMHGLGVGRAAPPTGPSIPPDLAAQYVGTYRLGVPDEPEADLRVTVVNDGDIGAEHWSLMAQEGDGTPYKLIFTAADSFVHQLDARRHIVFQRENAAVTSVELSGAGRVRHGQRLGRTERE